MATLDELRKEVKSLKKKVKDEEERQRLQKQIDNLKTRSMPKRVGHAEGIRRKIRKKFPGLAGNIDRAASGFI